MGLIEYARGLGLEAHAELSPADFVPSDEIRIYCERNNCGHYGNNYMCPPYIGTLDEIAGQLDDYYSCLLLRYSQPLDVKNDKEGLKRTRLEFHNKVLQVEQYLRDQGIADIWGLSGGNCSLCETCAVVSGKKCVFPDRARTSLEAIGIKVSEILNKAGLDAGFHPDRITWTGCVFFSKANAYGGS